MATLSVVSVETQAAPATKAVASSGGSVSAVAAGIIAAAKTNDAMLTTRSLPQRFRASPTQSAAKIDPAPNAARQRP